ncbi:MAG: ABC transporter permease [Chloroflexota bacterium]
MTFKSAFYSLNKSSIDSRDEPTPPTVIIEPTKGWTNLQLKAIWEYRDLLYFLIWRNVKVRYKQTALGVLWIILQPLISMLIFTILFGVILKVPSDGVPYPIFAYTALLPWQYFASALNRSSNNLVNNANLITKVYFPRIIIPINGVVAGLVDFGLAFLILVGLMIFYSITPTATVLWLPALLLLALITALGFGLWLSALNVRFRDIKHLVPFIIQIWMYITPVIYGSSLVPERFRWLLALNPMTSVVEGFRWALLGDHLTSANPIDGLFFTSIAIALFVLISGVIFFRSTERTFADII